MNDFISYMLDFYGVHGVYPYGFTVEEIQTATEQRVNTSSVEFYGDSLDREIVRDMIFKMRDPEAVTEYNV
jgi:hypothetical protein